MTGTILWNSTGDVVLHTTTSDPAQAHNVAHAVVAPNAQPWDSGDVRTGESWSHTFDTPGTYVYYCRRHQTDDMIGTITVTP